MNTLSFLIYRNSYNLQIPEPILSDRESALVGLHMAGISRMYSWGEEARRGRLAKCILLKREG